MLTGGLIRPMRSDDCHKACKRSNFGDCDEAAFSELKDLAGVKRVFEGQLKINCRGDHRVKDMSKDSAWNYYYYYATSVGDSYYYVRTCYGWRDAAPRGGSGDGTWCGWHSDVQKACPCKTDDPEATWHTPRQRGDYWADMLVKQMKERGVTDEAILKSSHDEVMAVAVKQSPEGKRRMEDRQFKYRHLNCERPNPLGRGRQCRDSDCYHCA